MPFSIKLDPALTIFFVSSFGSEGVIWYAESVAPNRSRKLSLGLRRSTKKAGDFENLEIRGKECHVATEALTRCTKRKLGQVGLKYAKALGPFRTYFFSGLGSFGLQRPQF